MRISPWRFWLPLLFQFFLIISIPADALYTRTFGRLVVLQTVPIDPYDLLRGYSQTLRYDISLVTELEKLAGWESNSNGSFYLILEAPSNSTQPPSPWKAIEVRKELPTQLPPNQIALRGEYDYSFANYGLERYYIPESQIEEINQKINQLQRDSPESFVVEVKIDSRGKATVISLWLGGERFEF